MTFVNRPGSPEKVPLAIHLTFLLEGLNFSHEALDFSYEDKAVPEQKAGSSPAEEWQAEQALYHAVRFHEGVE